MQAVNEKTGEIFELRGGQWVPVDRKPAAAEDAKPAKRDQFAGPISSGPIESVAASAGDALTTMGRNARSLWADARGDTEAQGRIIDERNEAAGIRQQMHEEAPISAGIGAMLPSLATLPIGMGVGGAGVLAGGLGRLATNVGVGAATGGLQAADGNIAQGAMEGGALSGVTSMAGNMVQRIRAGREGLKAAREAQAAGAAGVGAGLDDAERGILEGAQRSGMRVTPGQMLNDASMRKLEASASSSPVLSPYWDRLKADNARQLSTLAARAMGVEADNLSPGVMAAAEHRIGKEFGRIGKEIGNVDVTPLGKRLAELAEAESVEALPGSAARKLLKDFEAGATTRAEAAAGEPGANIIKGEVLMETRSKIAGEMRAAFANNKPSLGRMYSEVLDTLDDTVKKSAANNLGGNARGMELADAYDAARDKWTVLRAMQRGGVTTDGQLKLARMDQVMRKSDATRYVGRADDTGASTIRGGTGQLGQDAVGDFYDALRFANSRIGKDIVGDSGTVARLSLSGAFEGGLMPAAARLGGYAARRAVMGPLAQRYMSASPEALQAWNAAAQQSALTGWAKGQQAGAGAARAGGGLLSGGGPEE